MTINYRDMERRLWCEFPPFVTEAQMRKITCKQVEHTLKIMDEERKEAEGGNG